MASLRLVECRLREYQRRSDCLNYCFLLGRVKDFDGEKRCHGQTFAAKFKEVRVQNHCKCPPREQKPSYNATISTQYHAALSKKKKKNVHRHQIGTPSLLIWKRVWGATSNARLIGFL